MAKNQKLAQVLGPAALVVYGVGDVLGAGIYALVGKVAGVAGPASWVSFAISLGVATLTAFSYAELGGRFPKSGGAATFCREAFRVPWVAFAVGWLVFCSGIVTMATVSRAFSGYFQTIFPMVPALLIMPLLLLALGAVNFSGMKESSLANMVCTAVEVSGLLLIVVTGSAMLFGEGAAAPAPAPALPPGALISGAALAFFAFIGFEDLVNVAEEAKNPKRDLPRSLLTALWLAGGLYIAVAFITTRLVPSAQLAASSAPLAEVVRVSAPWVPAQLFSLVALFAVSNTALLNSVMASRLLYGMSEEGLLPGWVAKIHPGRKTPYIAVGIVVASAIALALSGTIVYLAGASSTLILTVFIAVNAALIVIKKRELKGTKFLIQAALPMLGVLCSAGLLAFMPRDSWKWALSLIALGAAIGLCGFRRGGNLGGPR